MHRDRVVFEVSDWRGRVVRLMNAQWSHVLKNHPEMADHLEAIRRTIEDPDVVTVSETLARAADGYRSVHSRRLDDRGLYVRAPVEYSPASNWITTAYLNVLPPDGEIEYVRVTPR